MLYLKRLINTTFKKITVIALLFALLTISTFFFYIVPHINAALLNQKEIFLHEMSHFSTEILSNLKAQEDAGVFSESDAQRIAQDIFNDFRHGTQNDNYFWINKTDDGTMLVHPDSELIGTNLADLVDEDSFRLGDAMLNIVRTNGDGYVQYKWPSKRNPEIISSKISYVREFEPWGWMIGTGIHIDDVQKEITQITWRIVGAILIILTLLVGLLIYIIRLGAQIEYQKNNIQAEFTSLIHHLPIGIFRVCVDCDEPPILWNDALLTLLEIPNEECLQKNHCNLIDFLTHDADKKNLKKLILTNKHITGEEYEAHTYTNKPIWIKLYGVLLKKNGNQYFDASIENVTQKRKSQEIMKKSYNELQKTDHMKDEIISITSHELRTPLTIIKGFTSILLHETFGDLNKTQKKYTSRILHSTNNLLEMITNMLDLEKIKTGKMHFVTEKVNLNNIIAKVYGDFQMKCAIENKEISFKKDSSNPIITTDATQLKRVLINLIDNAIKYTKPYGGKIEIFMKKSSPNKITIHVKDNGIGIAHKDLPSLFKKFKQIDGHVERIARGSGLGLPIAKNIVTQLGGTISVHSKAGEGSDFFIILPINK